MKKIYLVVVLFLALQLSYSQNSTKDLSVLDQHFKSLQKKSEDTPTDFKEWKVTSTASSLKKGLTHYYVTQYYKGIPIVNATSNLSVFNNKINFEKNQFITGLEAKIPLQRGGGINEETAINTVIRSHNLKPALRLVKTLSRSSEGDNLSIYSNTGNTQDNEPITVKKVYISHEGKLHLCWNVALYEEGGQNWWNSFVDVTSNTIVTEDNWVISCSFGDHDHTHVLKHKEHKKEENHVMAPYANTSMMFAPDSYNVYAMPLINPDDGGRSIVTNPAEATASPFGWHDTNGAAGAEFTITRGNNVWAQEDANGNNGTGASPSGGSSLDFDFPVNLNQSPSSYRDASTTNLFYWNNIMHDVWYQYGFDEASGNFQENNYGRGGTGSDSVNADSQDGSGTNNANFGTPPDGSNPRMQMFLWNRTNPGRDGSFDNIIIAHEYGHGISTRLVGGRNSNVLGGSEQMGEGWSDWFGLMLTMKAGDQGADRRGVGTYVLGQGLDGLGIRPTVYSTDRSINDTDYADIGGLARPHGVGYAFATILWDMTWLLIDQEGFDPDFYNGTGGNNIAMALVIEGLKNTAANPGFVSGRDGILQADQDLYGGQYRCLIWKAFAERGVGEGANENNNGGSNGQTDQTVSFTNPCDGGGPDPTPTDCTSTVDTFPYSESFETNDGWTQVTNDDGNWVRDASGTPSSGTGPSSGADGNFYMFLEASTNGSTGQIGSNATAILLSPCYDLSALSTATFSFSNHMFGTSVGSLTLEASTDGATWTSIWNQSGNQGNQWNAVNVDLASYLGETAVRLRFVGTTGSSWSSDIAIDAISLSTGGTDPDPDPGCATLNFNDFTITPFSNQDAAGDFSIGSGGASLTLTNNTWKYIPLNYTVTPNTVIEFEFSSTSQGEIHGVGFEDDNTLTSTRYFKVHGTQNYGITNFDNYSSGTTTYVIPVGDSYTGTMDRLVFINDNDGGSGNNSTFTNVRIYEGTCSSSSAVVVNDFGTRVDVLGDEDEGILTSLTIAPNPVQKGYLLNLIGGSDKELSNTTYTIINMLGQVIEKAPLGKKRTINIDRFESGVYILRLENENTKVNNRFIIK
ncbi:M36 family metallopeptidase [uncultured Tenacibaculum sp.]|uniref:M36 family metallopeptidase n=1 Tax=uncultured Tenacibaculum sp. TaxID=174713 RepID=UPI00263424B5|nr:M36 family metallopeptidase [uncultured Tenacibaculum sp.]